MKLSLDNRIILSEDIWIYHKEIAEILSDENARSYSKKVLDGKERILFSVLAEKNGLVSYGQVDQDGRNPCLVISLPLDLSVDDLINDPSVYHTFSEYIGKPVLEFSDIQLFGLSKEWEIFLNSLKRYGLAGLKRRTEIFMEYLVTHISSSPKYQEWIAKSKEMRPVLLGEVSKPFTICNKIYQPLNDNAVFISIDVKASIFQAYYDLGIIPQKTWASFMEQFTNDPYLINNKKLRLKVFGKLDKNKTNSILIPNTILPFYQRLLTIDDLSSDLMVVEGDEIVFKTTARPAALKEVLEFIRVDEDYLRISQYTIKYHDKDSNKGSYFSRHFSYPPEKVSRPDIKGAKPEDLRSAYIEVYGKLVTLTV